MSEAKKLSIVKQILGSYYKNNNEYLFHCPKCGHHKKKLSVNFEKDVFKCWVCDYSSRTIRRLVRKYGNFRQKTEWNKFTDHVEISSFEEKLFAKPKEQEEQTIDLPPGFISLANRNLPYNSLYARNYLKSRGINKQDMIRWKIGYCTEGQYAGRIIIPSFNINGDCNYFTARTYMDDWKKYFNPPISRDIIFNHLYLNFDEELCIVEGAFDAIVAGQNSVPLLGSTLREGSRLFQEIIKNDTPIYLALDPDAEKKAMNLVNKLLEYDIEIYKVNIDPYSDVGEMTKQEFKTRKEKAVLMTRQNYLLSEIMNM
tara:strand:- start:93 stop:1031 length:939 start_codon:yes stop_codon:yes gene_type:complete